MRLFSLIVILCLLSYSGIQAQNDNFEEFGKRFKAAVAKKDKKAVAEMMTFPFYSADWAYYVNKEPGSEITTKADFLKIYSKVITKDAMKMIAKNSFQKIEELYGEESYVYTLVFYKSPTSTAWLVFSQTDGQWKFTMTDNVSE